MDLPYSGDTMGMMRAVLNSNFWLTMHVMTIMIGYGSVFFAGFLASYHLVARFFGQGEKGLKAGAMRSLSHPSRGALLLFSGDNARRHLGRHELGTVLGVGP